MVDLPFKQFPALSAIGICRHAFAQRIPGIDVSHDKPEVMKRLDAAHRGIRNAIGVGDWPLFTANKFTETKSQLSIVQTVAAAVPAARINNSPAAMASSPINAVSCWAFTSPTAARFTLSIQRRQRSAWFIPAAKAASTALSRMRSGK